MAWDAGKDLRVALTRSHAMTVQVDVFTPSGVRAANVPIGGGTINANLLSDVSRAGSVQVTRRLIDQGLFDPTRDRVRISTGVPGFPLVPIFTGRVQEVVDDDSGQVQVQVEDFGRDLAGADFERPWAATPDLPVASEMLRIIQDVDADFGLDTSTALDGRVPSGLVWEQDRGEALDRLATGINCIWQSDRTGSFVLYPNPYNFTDPPMPVLSLTDGPGGTLTSLVESRSRTGVYNSVTVQVERPDNTPPYQVTARDTDPGSPFRWGGEYGKVTRTVRLQTPANPTDGALLAQRLLKQSLSLARSWRLTTPHFPLLDPGDVIQVTRRGVTTAQVVESISYPLAAIDATSIATRELRQHAEVPS